MSVRLITPANQPGTLQLPDGAIVQAVLTPSIGPSGVSAWTVTVDEKWTHLLLNSGYIYRYDQTALFRG